MRHVRGEDEHYVSESDQLDLFGAVADLPPAYQIGRTHV